MCSITFIKHGICKYCDHCRFIHSPNSILSIVSTILGVISLPPQPADLGRQSSAFEFRSQEKMTVEPTYENLNRDLASRASLRRRNSSVKDLIQRLEGAGRQEVPEILEETPNALVKIPKPVFQPQALMTTSRAKPVLCQEPLRISEEQEQPKRWVDGAAFFHNLKELTAPQCGRNSIIKIRQEQRGRVQDSVSKFSSTSSTPQRPSASRRLSTWLGGFSSYGHTCSLISPT